MKNAVGYVRVSTDNQFDEDRYGVENQKTKIAEYAEKNDFRIVKWFVDVASGASDNRPGMNEILFGEDVSNPPFEAVIAYKNDRIARDTYLYFYYSKLLLDKNIKLICMDEQFPEGSEYANILRSMMQFVAEQERKNIKMRTSGGRSIKSSHGGYSGGNLPFGYRSNDGHYEIVESEARIVRRIFDLNQSGLSLRKIADTVSAEGALNRSGDPVSFSNVRSILSNRKTYEGFYRYGDMQDFVQGDFEPILK